MHDSFEIGSIKLNNETTARLKFAKISSGDGTLVALWLLQKMQYLRCLRRGWTSPIHRIEIEKVDSSAGLPFYLRGDEGAVTYF